MAAGVPFSLEFSPMPHQTQPDSQKTPFGPKQLAWIELKYGRAHFRDGEVMVIKNAKGPLPELTNSEPSHSSKPGEQPARVPGG